LIKSHSGDITTYCSESITLSPTVLPPQLFVSLII